MIPDTCRQSAKRRINNERGPRERQKHRERKRERESERDRGTERERERERERKGKRTVLNHRRRRQRDPGEILDEMPLEGVSSSFDITCWYRVVTPVTVLYGVAH